MALVELLSKLTELALPLRAQAAESDFLHPVCDSPQQKLAETELGEARKRLPASRCILDRAAHACSGTAMR